MNKTPETVNKRDSENIAVPQIPWQVAQDFAKTIGMDFLVIVGRRTADCTHHVLTWGETPSLSAGAAEGGNRVKDICWPAAAPHQDKPEWLEGLLEIFNAASELDAAKTAEENTVAQRNFADALRRHTNLIREKFKL